jgi:PAB-dependent poly(A)-specific ribonuclease subunit 3
MTQSALHGLSTASVQVNPYAQTNAEAAAPQFYQDASSYKYPLNYHLYTPIGPQRANILPYQRTAADFFIPDDLREDLQRKSEAALQSFANSTLPQTVEYFHSLVALDTGQQKGAATFGYSSWVYKATSYRDGRIYALRRLEGFKLSNAHAIRSIQAWKRIISANLVQVHDAFTGRWFGDSSLVVVTDYHPRSQTLAEKYFAPGRNVRLPSQHIEESELWAYLVQLANVLKTIHEAGLAAQTITPSKILVTSKGRIRLNGCGIFDILNFEQRQAPHELQRNDLTSLGRLVLSIAARSINANANTTRSLEQVGKTYGERLKTCLQRLVLQTSATPGDQSGQSGEFTVQSLLTNIADKVMSTLDSAFEENDQTTAVLMRELENGRLVRLLAKLNIILERPDTSSTPIASNNPALLNQPSSAWSETGERYYLKLFRDYVFHQVDHEGRPVLDLGHIITCLNKLDAGIEEKIQLVSRDEQHVCVVSYKEVKRGFESAWQEIHKAGNPTRK